MRSTRTHLGGIIQRETNTTWFPLRVESKNRTKERLINTGDKVVATEGMELEGWAQKGGRERREAPRYEVSQGDRRPSVGNEVSGDAGAPYADGRWLQPPRARHAFRVVESRRCTPETNGMLCVNHPPAKKKKKKKQAGRSRYESLSILPHEWQFFSYFGEKNLSWFSSRLTDIISLGCANSSISHGHGNASHGILREAALWPRHMTVFLKALKWGGAYPHWKRSKTITTCRSHDTIIWKTLKTPPKNHQNLQMNSVVREEKLTCRNQLCFYILIMSYQKKKLRKQSYLQLH